MENKIREEMGPLRGIFFRPFPSGFKPEVETVFLSDLELQEGIFHPIPDLERSTQLFLMATLRAADRIGIDGFTSREQSQELEYLVDLLRPIPSWQDTFLVYGFRENSEAYLETMTLRPVGYEKRAEHQRKNDKIEIDFFFGVGEVEKGKCLSADPATILAKLEEKYGFLGLDEIRWPAIIFRFFSQDRERLTLTVFLKRNKEEDQLGVFLRIGEKRSSGIFLDQLGWEQPIKGLFKEVFSNWPEVFLFSFTDLLKKGKEAFSKEGRLQQKEHLETKRRKKSLVLRPRRRKS